MPHRWLKSAALVLITLLAYAPAMRCGYIWDDDYYVTRNFSLRSNQGLVDLWTRPGVVPQYYPVTHTTFWIEYQLWRLRPAGYHVVNILLHASSAVLLWLILRRLEIPGAWIAAAIFALHPVHVESVAWITERKNVLSGVLYLAALFVYLPLAIDEPRRWNWWRYAAVIVLFILALLSKSVTASLPAAILLIVWWKRGRLDMHDVLPLLPMFALGLIMSYVTARMEHEFVGAWGPEWNYTWMDRVLIPGRAVWFYAWKLLWPAKLTFIYPRWHINPDLVWQWLFPLAAVGLVAGAWSLRHKIGRGPLVALLLFGGTLLPALGFVNVLPMRYSYVADHFQYLASIALIVLIVATAARYLGRAAVPVAAVILIALGALTFRREFAFKDLRSLWVDTIDKNPDSWMVRNNYAKLLLEEENLDEAEVQLRAALRVDEKNPDVLTNLGVLFERRNHPEDAIAAYLDALEAGHDDWMAKYKLGRLLIARGRTDDGVRFLRSSIEARPSAAAYEELARVLQAQGHSDQAIGHLRRAVELDPDELTAQNALAAALLSRGQVHEAEQRLRDIVNRFPDSATAHNNLGIVLEKRGDVAGAVASYQRALQLKPGFEEAKRNLDRARSKTG